MKKLISSTVAMLVMLAFSFNSSAQDVAVQNGPKITFTKEVHDYGEVKHGADGHCTFTFKNTGNEPLVLGKVKGSCSCTVPEWPKDPIAPGETGELKVKYNTNNPGAINKSVTINSNAVNTPVKVIRIKGNVLPKPTSGAPVNSTGAPVK
ncbi:MAG: DUF1573 domain-containing protein [Crocinitomicaceae bacterium]|nr:DUF1573 domain-containing protein [Crocinitomicaceae bacterium]